MVFAVQHLVVVEKVDAAPAAASAPAEEGQSE